MLKKKEKGVEEADILPGYHDYIASRASLGEGIITKDEWGAEVQKEPEWVRP
jgi:hypothetical protein